MRATLLDSYLALLRVGFTEPRTVTSRAVRSYRTISPLPNLKAIGRYLFCCTAVGSHPPGVTWHPALWSPDFPPPVHKSTGSNCPADSLKAYKK